MIMIMDYDHYYYYYYYIIIIIITTIIIIIIIVSIRIIHILTILINNCQMIFSLFQIVKNTTLLPLLQKYIILSLFQNYHYSKTILWFAKQTLIVWWLWSHKRCAVLLCTNPMQCFLNAPHRPHYTYTVTPDRNEIANHQTRNGNIILVAFIHLSCLFRPSEY
jgi:hypothetical protein